jgi:gliding motility-associated-like protein
MLSLRLYIVILILWGVKVAPFCQSATSNRALLFAVNDYEEMNSLSNPIQNAKDIAEVLESRYGFEVDLVLNPTFEKMEQTVLAYQEAYRKSSYSRDGQLFVFFSGHGIKRGNNGYFMPADADPKRPYAKGIEYDFWRSEINNIDCKHILVAIDACHSITFDPNWQSKTDRNFSRPGERYADQVLVNHDSYRARLFFSSDAVGDQTPDRSTFARQLLEGLRTDQVADGYLTSSQLFANYMQKAAPTPGGGSFGDDEPGSCFLFFPKKQKKSKPTGDYAQRQADVKAYKAIQISPDIASCQKYLETFPKGAFRAEVNNVLTKLQEEVDWEYAALKNTKEAYQIYINDYPAGKYAYEAKARINDHLLIPDSFTPNNDGINDRLVVYADFLVESIESFIIYNRYGQIEYFRKNFKPNLEGYIYWNGEFLNSKPAPSGEYIYQFLLILDNGEKIKKEGNITLLRE